MMRFSWIKYQAEFENVDECQNRDDIASDGVNDDGLVPFLAEPSNRSYFDEKDDEPRPCQPNAVIKVL